MSLTRSRSGRSMAGGGMAAPTDMTPLRWLAWLTVLLVTGVLLSALAYIWVLAAFYGPGTDQGSRIGYSLKNAQRIVGDTPAAAARSIAGMVGGPTLAAPADPLAAAALAPLAASRGQTLVYGGGAGSADALAAGTLAALPDSRFVVLASAAEPAYALPAAYAAAHFRAPLVYASQAGLAPNVRAALQGKTVLVAAPERLIPAGTLSGLNARRVASGDLYQHALLWAQFRDGAFGWGLEKGRKDAYANFVLANPRDPAFAAAALPLAYKGNYGPLIYTGQGELPAVVDQYFWYFSPDFFDRPSDGPFMNVRVVGPASSVGYAAQARSDYDLETHPYRNQVQGMSGLAVLGWCWVFVGLAGAIWALFALPARVPDAGFYPRLYWPLAIFVLGPLGLIAFIVTYQGRGVNRTGMMPTFVRPAWARAVSATVMGMGVGMALMIAAMYLLMLNGMPLFTWLEFTPLFWLGSPMAALMWLLMVGIAVALSTLLFMGPMMAEMNGRPYWHGVRMAFPVVALSMVAASLGMFGLAWWWQNWTLPMMAGPELWLWPTVFWWAAAMGFLTALVPNYWLVRLSHKQGSM